MLFLRLFLFLQRKIESCSQDSPPAAGRFSDTLPLCCSAIPRSVFLCHRTKFPMTQKSRESSTDRGFLCYTYRSIRPARSVFHAHKYDSTSYTCRSSSYSSAWLYSDASDPSPFSLYSLIPDRNYLFMKIHPFSGFVKCFLNF